MKRAEIERLREEVGCAMVLSEAGFAIDEKESTRRAVKFRRAAEIIIVTHDDRGWFDPLSDSKGDVFSLVAHLDGIDFPACVERVASLVGLMPSLPVLQRTLSPRLPEIPPIDRWHGRRFPRWGSKTWQYLRSLRSLPAPIIRAATDRGLLREGPLGSMWAAHTDGAGAVVGWEERGPEWRGFATGGSKTLFRFGQSTPRRFCVTEAAIDAMSLAAIEGLRESTLYLSTGGGWSPQTTDALRDLVSRDHAQLVAATDANAQGDAYAERLRALAEEVGCQWLRLRPPAGDWNDVLKERERKMKGMGKAVMPHSLQPHQGKLRPARAGP
jgi:hypothetical protein